MLAVLIFCLFVVLYHGFTVHLIKSEVNNVYKTFKRIFEAAAPFQKFRHEKLDFIQLVQQK